MDMHFEGVVFHTYAAELARRMNYPHPPFVILDARGAAAFDRERIPGSRLYDASESELPSGTTEATEFFVVGTGVQDPSVRAVSRSLQEHGARRIVEVIGGMREWKQKGLPVEGGEQPAAA